MDVKPFSPKNQGTFYIANAVAASTPVFLTGPDQVVLWNTSATATAFVNIQPVTSNASVITANVATVPGTTEAAAGSFPVPPLAQIRVTTVTGHKSISAIASAADGNLYVTPGHGN
jgi:succinylarginine dihydrolase